MAKLRHYDYGYILERLDLPEDVYILGTSTDRWREGGVFVRYTEAGDADVPDNSAVVELVAYYLRKWGWLDSLTDAEYERIAAAVASFKNNPREKPKDAE